MTKRKPAARIDFAADEEWLELRGDPTYLISTHGRVYSTHARRIMKPFWSWHGNHNKTPTWSMKLRGNRTINVAAEVLHAFRPEPYRRDVVPRYLDGDRGNVRLENLMWQPRQRVVDRDHMKRIAKLGFAASPAAQVNVAKAENFGSYVKGKVRS